MGDLTITELRDQLNDVQHALSFVSGAVGSVPLTEPERLGAQVIINWVNSDLVGTSKLLEKIGRQGNNPS